MWKVPFSSDRIEKRSEQVTKYILFFFEKCTSEKWNSLILWNLHFKAVQEVVHKKMFLYSYLRRLEYVMKTDVLLL